MRGADNVLKTGKKQLTPEDLKTGLSQISGSNGFQGVSGQIAFDSHGDPVDKAVVVLHVSDEGFIRMEKDIEGRFKL
ncbi:hypothetical protein [Ktedonospora formicarum]|uniref:hypothetical protein n=1 Tax=Ktedonospora formicarum TaxID=2778364 RepID=UPI001C69212E|nr:hypothetical protein [Ktedonospora formicarum]